MGFYNGRSNNQNRNPEITNYMSNLMKKFNKDYERRRKQDENFSHHFMGNYKKFFVLLTELKNLSNLFLSCFFSRFSGI